VEFKRRKQIPASVVQFGMVKTWCEIAGAMINGTFMEMVSRKFYWLDKNMAKANVQVSGCKTCHGRTNLV
jgi:hypothetical protein